MDIFVGWNFLKRAPTLVHTHSVQRSAAHYNNITNEQSLENSYHNLFILNETLQREIDGVLFVARGQKISLLSMFWYSLDKFSCMLVYCVLCTVQCSYTVRIFSHVSKLNKRFQENNEWDSTQLHTANLKISSIFQPNIVFFSRLCSVCSFLEAS